MLRALVQAAIVGALLLTPAVACSREPREDSRGDTAPDEPLRFLFAETAGGATAIWSADPAAPADRRLLARVTHDPEWGIRAAVSPDGRYLAYTAMPSGARDPARSATLTLLDLRQRTSRRLATSLDLRTTPIWLADRPRLVALRGSASGLGTLVAIGLDGSQRSLAVAAPGERLVPVGGAAREGGLVMAVVRRDDLRLRLIDREGTARDIAPLGPAPSRGFAISPDGAALAFLRLEPVATERRYRAQTIDLATGRVTPLYPAAQRDEDTGVAWTLGGEAVVTALATAAGGGHTLGPSPWRESEREDGFDAVVGLSPDGRWLVLRTFAGGTTRAPGLESVTLLGADGIRRTVSAEGGVTPIGWRRGCVCRVCWPSRCWRCSRRSPSVPRRGRSRSP